MVYTADDISIVFFLGLILGVGITLVSQWLRRSS